MGTVGVYMHTNHNDWQRHSCSYFANLASDEITKAYYDILQISDHDEIRQPVAVHLCNETIIVYMIHNVNTFNDYPQLILSYPNLKFLRELN